MQPSSAQQQIEHGDLMRQLHRLPPRDLDPAGRPGPDDAPVQERPAVRPEADDRARGALVATLRAYASVDMNILQAAQRLRLHPNTIYARLNRIHELTGLQATSFFDLCDLLTVSDCMHHGVVTSVFQQRVADR